MNDLPPEIIKEILVTTGQLNIDSIMNVCLTNKHFTSLCKDHRFWKAYIPFLGIVDDEEWIDIEAAIRYNLTPIIDHYLSLPKESPEFLSFAKDALGSAARYNNQHLVELILNYLIDKQVDLSETGIYISQVATDLLFHRHLHLAVSMISMYGNVLSRDDGNDNIGIFLGGLFVHGYRHLVSTYSKIYNLYTNQDTVITAVAELGHLGSAAPQALGELLKLMNLHIIEVYQQTIIEGVIRWYGVFREGELSTYRQAAELVDRVLTDI